MGRLQDSGNEGGKAFHRLHVLGMNDDLDERLYWKYLDNFHLTALILAIPNFFPTSIGPCTIHDNNGHTVSLLILLR